MAVFIDGKQAAKLDPGQKASFYLPPDSVSVGAAYTGSGICSMGADRVEREAIVKDGAIKSTAYLLVVMGRLTYFPRPYDQAASGRFFYVRRKSLGSHAQ
ncbi:hypothetical protein [Pseudomonas putida]|uniref:hypothetical protein n=1 Tax=Pseudomonas putida TaxID=303 RepID=UPI000FDBA5F1|nr:hypothetical protein [Pseudomonas putida]